MSVEEWFQLMCLKKMTRTVIFNIPRCKLVSAMRQHVPLQLVQTRFMTSFADSLGITLDGNRYVFLVDMFKTYLKDKGGSEAIAVTIPGGNRGDVTTDKLQFTCFQHPPVRTESSLSDPGGLTPPTATPPPGTVI